MTRIPGAIRLAFVCAVGFAFSPCSASDVERAGRNRADLEAVRALPEMDRSFSPEERRQFEAAIDELMARAGQHDDAQLEMGITRAVALAANGHTYVRGVAMGRSLNSLPLRMIWFDDGLFVVAAKQEHANLLGARVREMGGHTPEDLAKELQPYVGGRPTRARLFSINFMTSPAAMHAIGLLPSPLQATFTFELPDGSRVQQTIDAEPQPAVTEGDAVRWPALDLIPQSLPAGGRWRHVLADRADLPLWLQQGTRLYWHTYPNPRTVYVAFRRTRDDGEPKLEDFLDGVIEEASGRRPQVAIVDLRANTGGAYEMANSFTRRLPSALARDGRVYVLTGPDTFSAGVVIAARLKHSARGRIDIVGGEMGDYPQFWAEGGRVNLPGSGLTVRYSDAFHDWEKGCGLSQIGRCHWLNFFFDVAAGDLLPTIPVRFTFADYIAGRDPVLAAVEKRP